MAKGTTLRMIVMLIIAAVVVGGVVWFQQFKNTMIGKAIKGGANPPQTVATTVAQSSSWQATVEALGNLRASQEASLGAEVGGLVTAIHFDSGEKVRAGQPLVELNPAPLRAQLRAARSPGRAGRAQPQARRGAAQGAGHQPGGRGHRRGDAQERAGAGDGAEGTDRAEDHHRAILRPARHPAGESRPVPRHRVLRSSHCRSSTRWKWTSRCRRTRST